MKQGCGKPQPFSVAFIFSQGAVAGGGAEHALNRAVSHRGASSDGLAASRFTASADPSPE